MLFLQDFNFAADDVATVYVDGEMAATTTQALVTAHLTVSNDACVIAVEVRNTFGVNKGFVASGSNGVLTDSSWRCTSYEDEGWSRRNHDDIHWYRAHEHYLNDATSPRMATIDGISPQAHYIWSAETADPEVSFCRLDLCTSCDAITDLYARAGNKIHRNYDTTRHRRNTNAVFFQNVSVGLCRMIPTATIKRTWEFFEFQRRWIVLTPALRCVPLLNIENDIL